MTKNTTKFLTLSVVTFGLCVFIFKTFQPEVGGSIKSSSELGCDNEIILQKNSPDSKHASILIERDCGATTSKSILLYVVNTSHAHGKSPVDMCDDKRNLVFELEGPGKVELAWLSSTTLSISNELTAESSSKKPWCLDYLDGVSVSYKTK